MFITAMRGRANQVVVNITGDDKVMPSLGERKQDELLFDYKI